MIVKLKHQDIDKQKWDSCIEQSQFPIAYAYSWYLDCVSPNWAALVIEEAEKYIAVFPLTERKKMGITYLAQPFFCQQLGLFHLKERETNIVPFIEYINKNYAHHEISINESNTCYEITETERTNLLLDLSPSYELLFSGFNNNRKRDFKKANQSGYYVKKSDQMSAFITFFIEQKGIDLKDLKTDDYQLLNKIFDASKIHQANKLYFVTGENNEIISACLFVETDNRIIFLLGTSNPEGKQKGVMTFIFNHIIKENCNKNKVLDFEGSNLEGVANFYKSLGGKQKKYISLKGNSFLWGILAPRIARLIQR